jgi:hypothetical protein
VEPALLKPGIKSAALSDDDICTDPTPAKEERK